MGNRRKWILLAALAYAIYSIGRGLLGIASESTPAIRIVIVISFLLILAAAGFAAWQLSKRKDAEDDQDKSGEDDG